MGILCKVLGHKYELLLKPREQQLPDQKIELIVNDIDFTLDLEQITRVVSRYGCKRCNSVYVEDELHGVEKNDKLNCDICISGDFSKLGTMENINEIKTEQETAQQ